MDQSHDILFKKDQLQRFYLTYVGIKVIFQFNKNQSRDILFEKNQSHCSKDILLVLKNIILILTSLQN